MRPHPPHRGADAGERLRQPGQQQTPGGAQLDLPVEAVKQADPEIGFERVDLMADCGRGHVQFLGGLRKAVQPRRRLEGPQCPSGGM